MSNNNETHLSVADIHFIITAEEGINMKIAPRYSAFLIKEQEKINLKTDVVNIKVCHDLPDPNTSPVKIWEVPKQSPSWKVFDYYDESRIFLYHNSDKEAIIISIKPSRFDLEIFIKAPDSNNVEIFQYPMDIIIMYYISMHFSLLIVHASGFLLKNCGHLCIGRSGAGKSTLHNLAAKAGGAVVQDDRLILRHTRNGWFMYPLPLREKDYPIKVKICRINALFHGPRNLAIPLSGTARINEVLPHIVQFPNWNHHYGYQLNLLEDLLHNIRLFQFFFVPDFTAIHYLQNGKDSGKSHYISPEKTMSSSTKGFRQKYDSFNLPG